MNVTFYTTNSKTNTINKVKTTIKSVICNAIEPISISTPEIKFKRDDSLIKSNYCYIDKFSRFYYIKNITFDKGMMIMNLEVDVLESFKGETLKYIGIIERQEWDYNKYLEDSEISAYKYSKVVYKNLSNSEFSSNLTENDNKFILITASN